MSVHSASPHTQPGAAKSVADILNAAADLIEPEGRWTQGTLSRDESGCEVFDPWDSRAACWCVAGAMQRAAGIRHEYHAEHWREYDAARHLLGKVVDRYSIAHWNDGYSRTQAEVVAALRAAAEKARADAETGSVGTTAEPE